MTGTMVVSIRDCGKKLCERQAKKHKDNNTCSLSWANLSDSALMPSGPNDFPHLSFSISLQCPHW